MAGTTTAKRAPAKKAATRRAAPPEPAELDDFYDQVDAVADVTEDDSISLDMRSKTERERAGEREKLFSIDGVEHTIPKKFGPNLALTYIDVVGQVGEDIALGRVLRAAMGAKSWEALRDFEDLETAQLRKILAITMTKVMGAIEEEKGKSGRASSK